MHIVVVKNGSSELQEIKSLARLNSATLGFLPEGAFDKHAAEGKILGMVGDGGKIMGYLLYRVSRFHAVLVQLCVASDQRKKGISRDLFRVLEEHTKHLRGISISTRREYVANKVWPRLGFAALSERPGRSKSGSTLTNWWYEHKHPTLFTVSRPSTPPTDVVIDSNIYYDIHEERPHSDEAKSLMVGWLQEEIRICVTAEIFNEIDRVEDQEARTRQKIWGSNYERIFGQESGFSSNLTILEEIYGVPNDDRRRSDLRHIAHTAASGSQIFVTRDDDLIARSDQVVRGVGVEVLWPASLIIDIDRLRDEAEYYPARLRGTALSIQRTTPERTARLASALHKQEGGESESDLRIEINRTLANPSLNDSWSFWDGDKPLGLVIMYLESSSVMRISLLRVANTRFSATLVRYFLSFIAGEAITKEAQITLVDNLQIDDLLSSALAESSYFLHNGKWTKINMRFIGSLEKSVTMLRHIVGDNGPISMELDEIPSAAEIADDKWFVAGLERSLFPAKILGSNLRTVVLAIKPTWAESLFDYDLAAQSLFFNDTQLALSRENVYYRSPRRAKGLESPCRILWYVTRDTRYGGAGSIRACSQAVEISILSARDAYKRYRRLGIYTRNQIIEIAKGDVNGSVMAIRFMDTEQFINPIGYREAIDLIKQHDGTTTKFRGPTSISDSAFQVIYEQATQR